MKKYTIIGVLVLMSISLMGVVGLQLYWINDAIKVKQEQFDRAVNDALLSVVDKLETQEAVSVVTERMASLQNPVTTDSVQAEPVQPVKAYQPVKKKQATKADTKKATSTAETDTHVSGTTPAKVSDGIRFSSISRTYPVTTEKVWLKENSGTSGVVVRDKKGQLRLLLTNGDTLSPRVQGLQELTHLPVSGKLEDIKAHANFPSSVHIYTESPDGALAPGLNKGEKFVFGKHQDSVTSYYRIIKQPISISADTLRVLASKLDSLHQFTRFSSNINKVDVSTIESIKVRNDSVFVYSEGNSKPLYVSHTSPDRVKGAKTWSRNPQQNSPVVSVREGSLQMIKANEKAALRAAQSKKAAESTDGIVTVTLTPEELAANEKARQKPATAPENRSTTEKVEQKTEKLNDVVQKMMVEYVVKDIPLRERLNTANLQSLLQTELQKQGICMPFGYWVVSSKEDTVVARNVAAYNHTDLPKYKAALFPNDIVYKSDHLNLFFPDSKSYAIRSLWGMLALSAFFTFVIIATFGTTIHIIYKQKKLSEMKNDFINNMTHEFKTPIATISLATDSIANPKIYEKPEKIAYYTNIIRQENKRMNAQVENVLQIARLEKNDYQLAFKPVDVHELISKAIESIRLQVEERMGQIHVQLNALQHELHSDETHLFNVICNLLDNANKYSPSAPEIMLVTQNVDGGLLLAVEDKGMGMSKEAQQRVFDKFYRVSTGNLHNVKGFGLGLSYVKAIVQAHKGNVRLKSEPGKGSRFEIFLPLSKTE